MNDITTQLTRDQNGIYITDSKGARALSFPEKSHNICFDIEDNSVWFRHRNNVIGHFIKKYFRGGTFADLGGGNGAVSVFLQKQGIKTMLIEPSHPACQNAKRRGVLKVICGTLADLKQKNSLDAVGLFDVLEHIKDEKSFLTAVHQALTAQGLLFITVPAHRFLWSKYDACMGHYRRYTRKMLKKILRDNNFKVLTDSYFFSFLVVPIFISKVLLKQTGERHLQKRHLQRNILLNYRGFLELKMLKIMPLPFGSSISCIAQKI